MLSPNRILDHAEGVRKVIASGRKPDGDPVGDIDKHDAEMDLGLTEYIKYQELKSLAQLRGIITVDEAQTIYAALGGEVGDPANGGWGADTDVAMKTTVTMFIGQLLGIE